MKKRHHEEIRRSQLVRTFGPGAMVDLPNHSIVVSGLDSWFPAAEMPVVVEERLSLKVANVLGLSKPVPLKGPPVVADDERSAATGVPAFQFPEWFVVQVNAKRRPLVHLDSLQKGKYEVDRKKVPAVPVRFVQACVLGHLADVDWRNYIHRYRPGCARPIWMEERGSSGDLADVVVGCECGEERSMAQATRRGAENLGECTGGRPWLGRHGGERCGGESGKKQLARLLVRSASDAYFAQVLSVISLPDRGSVVRDAVAKVWENFLSLVEEQGELAKERKRPAVKAALDGLTDEEVWAEIGRRKGGAPAKVEKIKEVELATLLSVKEKLGEGFHGGHDFLARRLALTGVSGPMKALERVVLVDRLREVTAQVGFTRFEAQTADIDGELSLDVRTAPLAAEVKWVPAVENRGEGIFLALDPARVAAWLERPGVEERG
ncbi:MAG TPA: DrmB family protein, partial [Thermoanaerobaculia bacterium]|nr:DrmB family protein [Thermoanaerobaculia bacterium]